MNGYDVLTSTAGELAAIFGSSEFLTTLFYFLSFIFVWSGIVKVRHPDLAAQAIVNLGVRSVGKRSTGMALGLLELSLALVLLPLHRWLAWSAGFALLIFFAFCALIDRTLRSGRQVPCFCFGNGEDPVTRFDFSRSFALGLLSGFAMYRVLSLSEVRTSFDLYGAVLAVALLMSGALVAKMTKLFQWNTAFIKQLGSL